MYILKEPDMMKIATILILTLTLLFLWTTAGSAQTQMPDNKAITIPPTETGQIVKEFIDAVNSDKPAEASQFAHKYLSTGLNNVGSEKWDEEKYNRLLLSLQQGGGLVPVDFRQNHSLQYLGVIFRVPELNKMLSVEFVKNDNSNTLRYIEVHSMSLPAGPYQWPERQMNEKEIAEEIGKRIQKEVTAGQFSGVALIAHNDRIIINEAYGYADREKNRMNTVNTRIHTGSVGKMLTAAAIGQLAEKGKLKFSDTLGTILPDYPNHKAAHSVTIAQLLTHTAGIADPFELGKRMPGADYSTAASNLNLIAPENLTMEPGAYHSYSNGNYSVLAAVVEKLSGMSFEKYLKENIFKPAGMAIADKDGYSRLPRVENYSFDPELDPFAVGSRIVSTSTANTPEYEYSGFSNAYLTAEDVYRFMLALRQGKLVSPEMVEILTRGKVDVGQGAPVKYAYGFYDATMWGTNMRGHSGGGGHSGIGAEAEMIWDSNYYVILLGNYDLDTVRPLAFSIARFLGNK